MVIFSVRSVRPYDNELSSTFEFNCKMLRFSSMCFRVPQAALCNGQSLVVVRRLCYLQDKPLIRLDSQTSFFLSHCIKMSSLFVTWMAKCPWHIGKSTATSQKPLHFSSLSRSFFFLFLKHICSPERSRVMKSLAGYFNFSIFSLLLR